MKRLDLTVFKALITPVLTIKLISLVFCNRILYFVAEKKELYRKMQPKALEGCRRGVRSGIVADSEKPGNNMQHICDLCHK